MTFPSDILDRTDLPFAGEEMVQRTLLANDAPAGSAFLTLVDASFLPAADGFVQVGGSFPERLRFASRSGNVLTLAELTQFAHFADDPCVCGPSGEYYNTHTTGLIATQTTLGTNVQGAFPTVRDRLEDIESKLGTGTFIGLDDTPVNYFGSANAFLRVGPVADDVVFQFGVDWSELTNVPSTFPPSPHTHPWDEITDKPDQFPPEPHTTALITDIETGTGPGQMLFWGSAGYERAQNVQVGFVPTVQADLSIEFAPAQGGGGLLGFKYDYRTATTNDPGPGEIHLNNADPLLATEYYCNILDKSNEPGGTQIALADVGDQIVMIDAIGAAQGWEAEIDAPGPSVAGDVVTVPLTNVNSVGPPLADQQEVFTRTIQAVTTIDTFLGLIDTPGSYASFGGQILRVAGGETSVVFQAGVDWSELTSVPASFPPDLHGSTHELGGPDELTIDWTQLANVPVFLSTFVELTDTPSDYVGAGLQIVRVNAAEDALEFVALPPDVNTFLGLTDTPPDYVGAAGDWLRVTDGEDGVEFSDLPAEWRGVWDGALYQPNDMVLDQGFLMIAITETNDRAAPIPVGPPDNPMPDDPAWDPDGSFVGLVSSGATYEFSEFGFIQGVRVWCPDISGDTEYRVLVRNVTDPAEPVVVAIASVVPLADDRWVTVPLDSGAVLAGTKVEVSLIAQNSSGSTVIAGAWTYNGTSQNANPSTGGWNTNNQSTTLRIDKTDLASDDRTSELLAMEPGTVVRFTSQVDPSAFTEFTTTGSPADAGSAVTYAVFVSASSGSIGTGDNTDMSAEIPVPAGTPYKIQEDWWLGGTNQPTYATVEGLLSQGGVPSAAADDAFGVDIEFQQYTASPDWELMSSIGGSGGTGGGGELPAPHAGSHELGGSDEVTIDWTQLASVPATFPPSPHTHVFADITDQIADSQVPESAVTQHEGAIDHDALTNYVADQHVAHSAVLATAGPGLKGGGDLTASFAFELGIDTLGVDVPVPTDEVVFLSGVTHERAAISALPIDWAQLTSVPAEFPPSPHTHTVSEITDFPFVPQNWVDLGDTVGSLGSPGEFVVVSGDGTTLEFQTLTAPGTGFLYDYVAPNIGQPPAGDFEFNNADPSLATICHINEVDFNGNFIGTYLAIVADEDLIIFAGATAANGLAFVADGPAIDQGAWWDIPIKAGSVDDQGAIVGQQYRLQVQRASAPVLWDDIIGKPSEFPPEPHTHDAADVISGIFPAARGGTGIDTPGSSDNVLKSNGAGGWVAAQVAFSDLLGSIADGQVPESAVTQHQGALQINWDQLVGAQPPPIAHTHPFSEITGVIADAQVPASAVVQHEGDINHNALENYFPDEHVDHAGVVLTAGPGLANTGGDITASRTFQFDLETLPIGTTPQTVSLVALKTGTTNHRVTVAQLPISYNQLLNVPGSFPPDFHTHPFSEITGQIANAQVPAGAVTQYESILVIDWNQLVDIPSEFPPEPHTHTFAQILGVAADPQIAQTNVTQHQGALVIDWSQLQNVPTQFPPESHTHPFTQITGTISDAQVPASAVVQHESELTIDYSQLINVPPATTTFLDLTDTPGTYGGSQPGDFVVVNGSLDGLEFVTLTPPAAGFIYTYESTVSSNVAPGEFAFNNADPNLATEFYINEIDDNGNFIGSFFAVVQEDDWWIIAGATSASGAFVQVGPGGGTEHAPGQWTFPIKEAEAESLVDEEQYRVNLQRPASGIVDWDDIINKPSEFPPEPHTHDTGDIVSGVLPVARGGTGVAGVGVVGNVLRSTGSAWSVQQLQFNDLAGTALDAQIVESNVTQHQAALQIDWSQLVGTQPPPPPHTHTFAEITGQAADSQITQSSVVQYEDVLTIDWDQIINEPTQFPPEPHQHTVSDIIDFPFVPESFTDLDDTPPNYIGASGQVVVVNGAGTGLEFVTFTPPSAGFNYNYDAATGAADPGPGNFRFNNANPELATELYINEVDLQGNFTGALLTAIRLDDWIVLAGAVTASGIFSQASGPGTDNGSWWTIPLAQVEDEGSSPGQPYRFNIQRPTATVVDWDDIVGKPTEFPPEAHTHDASEIVTGTLAVARGGTNLSTVGAAGNVLKSTGAAWVSAPVDFDELAGVAQNPQIVQSNVTQHQAALQIGWGQLTGVPSSFPPEAHAASHQPGGADELRIPDLWSPDNVLRLFVSGNGWNTSRNGGTGRVDFQVTRYYARADADSNWSGLWQSQAGSWPTGQTGWFRLYAGSGGNALRGTRGNGEQIGIAGFSLAASLVMGGAAADLAEANQMIADDRVDNDTNGFVTLDGAPIDDYLYDVGEHLIEVEEDVEGIQTALANILAAIAALDSRVDDLENP